MTSTATPASILTAHRIAICLMALAVMFLTWNYREAHDAQVKLAATIEAQKTVIDQASKDRDARAADDARRDAQTIATISSMQKAIENVQTPAQIAAFLQKSITPAAPQPITIEVPKSTESNPVPPAQVEIPQADLPALRNQVEACQECSVKLASAQKDVTSLQSQLKDAGKQLSAVSKERDAAVKASKGGGFWSRVKRSVKFFAIGAAAGAAAVCGTGHCK